MWVRSRVPLIQIVVAITVGVASGMYIFKPYFDAKREQNYFTRTETESQSQTETRSPTIETNKIK